MAASTQKETTKLTSLPLPTGWYALLFANELKSGQLTHDTYFGQELIIFRTASGKAAVMDAYCPHLGAHIGHGGRVEGETVRCPFHGFRFAGDGVCVSTPYAKRLPRVQARTWSVCERNGIVYAWYDPDGGLPSWEIPELDLRGFSRLHTQTWRDLPGHPQEIAENSVDLGHFSQVHGFRDARELAPLRTDGSHLNSQLEVKRVNPFLRVLRPLEMKLDIHVHGLGCSIAYVVMPPQKFATYHFVLPTPTRDGHIDLRIAFACRSEEPAAMFPLLRLWPRRLAIELLAKIVMRAYASDIGDDLVIWTNKRYIHPPCLAEGDGPIGAYRTWCAQFYRRARQPRSPAAPQDSVSIPKSAI